MSSSNIVVEWLRSLHLGQYAESFLDNGYDDLEICKQVGEPDLDAIGVFNATHRARLLQSVRTLREEGAASVYFTLEESQAIQEECKGESSSRSEKGSSGGGSAQELPRYLDEYEEGKAELSRMPRSQIRSLVREKLRQEGVRLSGQPYSTVTGDRGYLEGLAGRYSEVIGAYNEVLNVLEELRLEEWAQLSPRFRVLNTKVNQQGSLTRQAGLVTSLSQPIYVPGKYSPSSCLSDREEDEIYGFTGYQNAQPQQPIYGACKAPRTPARHPQPQPQPQLPQQQPYQINKHNYQNWLNPRSAYFYELPPSERPKKRASLIRFLRHLKTGRKDKNASRSNHRVGTPEDGPVNSPLDYDKMRLLQKSSRTITFEETIHRLKVQEAMKKKEKIDRDHEEFLREIRAGVLVGACSAASGGSRNDDTYMYDEDSARLGQHWYDEPPYESDPEDFLMSDTPPGGPHARLCFAMGGANDQMGVESEVISLRSAGDISLPHHQRAILVPPHSRALRGANRESGDYAASDVNSICSRLSSLSMETSRSEHLEMDVYHRLRPYNGTEPPISPGHSSDYADQEELMGIQPPQASSSSTVQRLRAKCNADMSSSSGKSLGRRHHHHHHHHHHHVHHRHRHPHHSSAESLPSASSTQALVNNMDDYSPQGPALPLARALVDSSPNLYDKEALRFKKGDIIEVMSMSSSGLWRGRAHNRTGHFKFINVELLSGAGVPHHHGLPFLDDDAKSDVSARRSANGLSRPQQQPSTSMENCVSGCANRPTTLEQMLQAIHMEEHMSLFVLNGFEDLESFCEIREEDLDYLGINDPENRAKILAAVQVLQEFEQEEGSWNNDSTNAELSTKEANNFSQQNSTHPLSAGSEKNNMLDEHRPPFLPNIPVISSNCEEPPPLPAPEGGGGMFGGGGQILAGGGTAAATSGDSSSSKGGGGGSEKSSDSGVSSSSGSSSGGRSTTSGGGHRSMGGSRGRPPPPPPPPKPSPPPPPSYVNQIPTVSTPSD